MARKYNAALFIIIVIAAICLFSIEQAYAGNGTRFIGFSARDSGMGGASTASSEDTSCLVKNPAGLVRIGNRVDLEYLNIIPHDVTMHTEGPPSAALGGLTLANVGLRQKSTIGYLPGGNGGISYRIPDTDQFPVSVGCGAFTMAGVAVDYPSSRILTALSGDYDKMTDLRSMRIAPGIAVALTDKLSFGAVANIAIQALSSNLATAVVSGGRYLETAGSKNWDFAVGGGFTLGLLYKFNEMLSLGTSFESKTWMGRHHQYKDILPIIDEPNVVNAGVSLKPIRNFEWTFDTRYINWTTAKLARNGPGDGGFGWGDQWIFATGAEYTIKDKKDTDMLKLRLGYNYGKSQIQRHVIFANAILPLIMEHHLTTGFSYFLTKDLSLDFVWEHHFKSVMSDNGEGDVYSVLGKGTKISAAGEVIGVGVGYKF